MMRNVFSLLLLLSAIEGSDIYKAILDRALQRNTRTYAQGFHKYTVEHDALVLDVVKNYNDQDFTQLFEIYNKLAKDAGLAAVERGSFHARSSSARKRIGQSVERNSRDGKVVVGTWKLLPKTGNGGTAVTFESKLSEDLREPAASSATTEGDGSALHNGSKTVSKYYSEKDFENSGIYRTLLSNARDRKTRTLPKWINKYTSEHDVLVMDVVKAFSRDVTRSRQFEIYNKLAQDLGMLEMPKGSFYERMNAARRCLGDAQQSGSAKPPAVGVAASKLLENLFDRNPKISETEALKALESDLRDGDSPVPSLNKVHNWLNYRKAMRRFSFTATEINTTQQSSSLRDDDVDLGRDVSFASTSSLEQNFDDGEGFWNEILLALADGKDHDCVSLREGSRSVRVDGVQGEIAGNVFPGLDIPDDKDCRVELQSCSAHKESRKRKRTD
jgi:hypothetical protein